MTRSLVVLDRLPYPPLGGQQLRYRQAIEALAALGPVTLLLLGRVWPAAGAPAGVGLVPADPEPDRSAAYRWASALGPRAKKAVRARLRARHQAGLRRRLARLVDRLAPDLVVVENPELAGYLPPLKAPGRAVVYDAHNVERVLWGELTELRAELGAAPGNPRFRERILAGEAHLAACADQVWACSADDARLFAATYPDSRAEIRVVPNAVDTGGLAAAAAAPFPAGRRAPTVLFTANFGYAPNVEAALILLEEVRPRLLADWPASRLVLCGRQPPPELLAAAGREPAGAVVVTGEVPDAAPWFAACDAFAVPLRRGGGTRIKILEALAACRPVVSTRKGAEGLDLEEGRHLRLAEEPEAFAAALSWCLREPEAARAMARRGAERVEALYSWSANAARVRAAVAALAPPAERRAAVGAAAAAAG